MGVFPPTHNWAKKSVKLLGQKEASPYSKFFILLTFPKHRKIVVTDKHRNSTFIPKKQLYSGICYLSHNLAFSLMGFVCLLLIFRTSKLSPKGQNLAE